MTKLKSAYFTLAIALIICLSTQWSWADSAYVTDSITITLRTGPSIENKVIASLSSGQPVEVLDSNGDWSHVFVLKNGERTREGWVLTRYLMSRQPCEVRGRALITENNQLKENLMSLEKKFDEVKRREEALGIKLQNTAKALDNLNNEHQSLKAGAEGYLKLKDAHAATQSKLETIQKEFDGLNKKYETMRSSQTYKWFIAGAGVLLFGLIIGLVLGSKQRKRRSSYY